MCFPTILEIVIVTVYFKKCNDVSGGATIKDYRYCDVTYGRFLMSTPLFDLQTLI